MIWRLRDREDFTRIRAQGSRFGHGELWMYWLSDHDAHPPRVGYSIGRVVGPAVTRNRVRRRLRALFHDRARAGRVPPGSYVVGCRPAAAHVTFAELGDQLDRLLGLVSSRSVAP